MGMFNKDKPEQKQTENRDQLQKNLKQNENKGKQQENLNKKKK